MNRIDIERIKESEVELVGPWRKCVTSVMASDGYFVAASKSQLRIGAEFPQIPGASLGQPFYVIAPATYEDCLRQFEHCRAIAGVEMIPPPSNWYFYKLQTD